MSDRSRYIIEHQTSNCIKREAGDKSGSCVCVCVQAIGRPVLSHLHRAKESFVVIHSSSTNADEVKKALVTKCQTLHFDARLAAARESSE